MRVREAMVVDTEWVNARYAEVDFQPSDLSRELVLIAEIDGTPAGLGRLVPIAETSCELGGMLVFPPFRGRGVARLLIDALLSRSEGRDVYCIPYADLEALYAAAGFERSERGPAQVLQKVGWCRRTYSRDVVLMKWMNPNEERRMKNEE
jgi:GNAT superfamily N-acetyltransferase